MEEKRNDVPVVRNSDEVSSQQRSKDTERWHLNFTEIDPTFDFQFNYVKYRRTWNLMGQHIHENSAEIVWVMHGRQFYTVDGEEYSILGGQILISPLGLVHQSRVAEEKGDFFYLTINPDCLSAIFPADSETADTLRSLLSNEVAVRVLRNISQLSAIASDLRLAFSDARLCRKSRIMYALFRLLIITLDAPEIDTDLAPYSTFMERVYLFIEDHIAERLTVKDVASAVQYSETGLQRKFRAYSNLSVHEYILNRKIEAAKRMMIEQDTNPYRVWKQLAFSSQSYFSQVFRKYTGLTISQYLRQSIDDERQ